MAAKRRTDLLVSAARKARSRAYSPYSGVKIGAAVLASDGSVYTGANIENASYGLACCAERTAIFKAVSEGAKKIVAIAVVGTSEQFTSPCGACRQVMTEFNPKMRVIRRGLDGFAQETVASSLLPGAFGPSRLKKR